MTTATKQCSGCGQVLPTTEFRTFPGRPLADGTIPVRLRSRCLACARAAERDRSRDNYRCAAWVRLHRRRVRDYWRRTHEERLAKLHAYRAQTVARRRAARRRESLVRKMALAEQTIAATCAEYGIDRAELLGRSRAEELMQPRRVLAYLLLTDVCLPVTRAARLLGFDHSTLLHHRDSLRRHRPWEEQEMIRAIKQSLGRYRGQRTATIERHKNSLRTAERKAG